MPAPLLLLTGAVDGVAIFVAVAGATQVLACMRRADVTQAALRRAIRWPVSRWRRTELIIGLAEMITAGLVVSGLEPTVGCAAMAVLGVVFTAGLIHVRRAGIPGDCGCLRLSDRTDEVTSAAVLRASSLVLAGAAGLVDYVPGAVVLSPIGAAGGTLALIGLIAISAPDMRRPRSHRRVLFARRDALSALQGHAAFISMERAIGPFEPVWGHARRGCVDQFMFRATGERGYGIGVRFSVTRAQDRAVAVHAVIVNAASSDELRGGLRRPIRIRAHTPAALRTMAGGEA